MKKFLGIFAISLIIVYAILFFMNTLNNGWLNLIVLSLVLAVVVNAIFTQRVMIAELHERIKVLEEKNHIKPRRENQ